MADNDFLNYDEVSIDIVGARGGIIVIDNPNSTHPERFIYQTVDEAVEHIAKALRRNFGRPTR